METQDEMIEMKNKIRVLEHQAQQLKDEVANRDAAVVKEHLECVRLDKDKEMLVSETQFLKTQAAEMTQVIWGGWVEVV